MFSYIIIIVETKSLVYLEITRINKLVFITFFINN